MSKIKKIDEMIEEYASLGWPEEAFKHPHWLIRLEAYEHHGFTHAALNDSSNVIRDEAEDYFKACAKFLELKKIKHTFTKDEASFLNINHLKVNKKSII